MFSFLLQVQLIVDHLQSSYRLNDCWSIKEHGYVRVGFSLWFVMRLSQSPMIYPSSSLLLGNVPHCLWEPFLSSTAVKPPLIRSPSFLQKTKETSIIKVLSIFFIWSTIWNTQHAAESCHSLALCLQMKSELQNIIFAKWWYIINIPVIISKWLRP